MKISCAFLLATTLAVTCAATCRAADSAHKGPAAKDSAAKDQIAMDDVRQLNTSMFGIYDKGLAHFQKNFPHPLIMALFSGKGGRFILYRPGQPPLEAPSVPPVYEIMKSTGHSAMGTYALVAPYITDATTDQEWVADMKDYRSHVQIAKDNVDNLDITPEQKALVQTVLGKVLAFMDTCLKNGTFTSADVEAYTRGVEPDCEKLIAVASSAQVGHWFEVLTEWKRLLGDEWSQTYALSNSIYVARQNNILFSVLVQFMGEDAINNRLIMLETTDFQASPEDMRTAFARIASDRILGKYFFNNDRLMDYELLGWGGRAAIETQMTKLGRKAVLPPLVPINSTEWPWKTDVTKGSGPRSFDDLHKMGLLKSPEAIAGGR
jgi:hypothetical protein